MSWHEVLGVSPDASHDEVKIAYKTLSQRFHPDRQGGDVEKFRAVQDAYTRSRTNQRCPVCAGKGFTKTRRGAFVDTVECPKCWRKEQT